MPRLWDRTIEAHRREVREAVVAAAAVLVAERGLRGVTMSEIAERSGIGRATLYKYFHDIESILLAWHERQIAGHLASLHAAADEAGDAAARLRAVLEAYALIARASRGHDDPRLVALLHRDEEAARAEKLLHRMFRHLLAEAAEAGAVRDDVPADELASYCLHALAAARTLPSRAAAQRLVGVVLAALRSQS